MNNVINFEKNKNAIPTDLISFKDFANKYEMKVGYLYKLCRKGDICRHKRGVWKISESEDSCCSSTMDGESSLPLHRELNLSRLFIFCCGLQSLTRDYVIMNCLIIFLNLLNVRKYT